MTVINQMARQMLINIKTSQGIFFCNFFFCIIIMHNVVLHSVYIQLLSKTFVQGFFYIVFGV